jgi:hypothetical protein
MKVAKMFQQKGHEIFVIWDTCASGENSVKMLFFAAISMRYVIKVIKCLSKKVMKFFLYKTLTSSVKVELQNDFRQKDMKLFFNM